MMKVPRGRFMVIPDGVKSSAWQSWTCGPRVFLTANTAGTRSVPLRSALARRRSLLMVPILGRPPRSAKKLHRALLERLGLFDDEVRNLVDDQIRQLAVPALEGGMIIAQPDRSLALRASQDVDELLIQRHPGLLPRGPGDAGGVPPRRLGSWRVLPKIKRELGVLLATFAALASGVTLWTWLAFECIPLEVFSNDTNWYTECGPPTP